MKTLKLFAIATVTACVIAITPPLDAVNGVYKAYFDEQGREVHELVALPNGEAPSSKHVNKWITNKTGYKDAIATANVTAIKKGHRQSLEKRWHDSEPYGFGVGILNTECGCGFYMDHGDCDAAVNDLKAQSDRAGGGTISIGNAWYSIRGSVVAFACATWPEDFTKTGEPFEFDSSSLTVSYAAITRLCGSYVAGTLSYLDWGVHDWNFPDIGYMRYSPGDDFCSHADDSKLDHC